MARICRVADDPASVSIEVKEPFDLFFAQYVLAVGIDDEKAKLRFTQSRVFHAGSCKDLHEVGLSHSGSCKYPHVVVHGLAVKRHRDIFNQPAPVPEKANFDVAHHLF